MADNEQTSPGAPAPGGSTALQLRTGTELSTQVYGPEPTAAQEGDDSIHFLDLWRVLVKRKWAIFSVLILVIAAAAVMTMLATPIYRASITLKIDRESVKVTKYEGRDQDEAAAGFDPDFYRTQYELLKSRTLAERVVEQLNLRQGQVSSVADQIPWWSGALRKDGSAEAAKTDEEAAQAAADAGISRHSAAATSFLRALTVEPVRNSRLVRIFFDSPDRKLAADALNTLAQNYINVNLERRYDASSYAKTFLEEKLAQTKVKLEESEKLLVEFQRDQQIINVDEKQNVLGQTLAEYNQAAAKAEQERTKAQAMYDQFKASPEAAPQVLDNKSIGVMREQLAKLQVEYQDGLRVYKPAFPKMQQLNASIEALQAKITEEIGVIQRSIQGSYQATVNHEKAIQVRLEAAKRAVLDLQGRSIQYNILKREVDTNRSLYDGLLQRLKEVGVAAGVGTNNVTIVDPAEPPRRPFKPNLFQNLAIALVLGLALGIGLAFFLEYLDDSLRTPGDLERLTGLPVLGIIPLIRQKKTETAKMLATLAHDDARSGFAEAYRSVRTALQFSTRQGAPRQLVITSTSAGEGKSTTGLSLAINFAQTGRPALIVDADLRNPSLHKYLGVENTRGLSNYLSSDLPALSVVRPTSIPNLYVIPTGPLPPNPVELLSGPKLAMLLSELREKFGTIIIDSPPVLGIADALVLGNQVGALMFVVAAGTTRKAHAKAALKRLKQAGVVPIGAVMTKTDLRDGMYGYESAYYYYKSGSTSEKTAKLGVK